jgi:folate-binding protein YgfZ
MARIAAGVARVGIDTGPSTLVQEAALEARAVSFEKGCYLGQETVARLQFRGRANRALRGLVLAGPAETGAPVVVAGREVGRLTSVAATPDLGLVGLAILRRELEPGSSPDVGAVSARVVELPFEGGA